jgi:hypothetical protein
MGPAFANDCIAFAQGNKIIIDLPLSLLGNSDGDVLVRNESLIQPGNTGDVCPDQGALSAASGRLVSPFACSTSNVERTDPIDATDGQRNDELLAASACLSLNNPLNDNVLLLRVRYADLKPNANGLRTRIYFDTDLNPNTGTKVSNANSSIGAEFVLEYRIDLSSNNQNPAYIVELTKTNNQAQVYRQLASFALGTNGIATVSIPLSLLDRDDGNLNIILETVVRSNRFDVLPDMGVIEVRRP